MNKELPADARKELANQANAELASDAASKQPDKTDGAGLLDADLSKVVGGMYAHPIYLPQRPGTSPTDLPPSDGE